LQPVIDEAPFGVNRLRGDYILAIADNLQVWQNLVIVPDLAIGT